jgi:phosphate transport system permease protein
VVVLFLSSHFQDFGFAFFGPSWNPNPTDPSVATYGILYFVIGSAVTAGVVLVLAMLLSLGIAISLVVFLPSAASRALTTLTDLLAGIPSVVYGIWGYVILAPYFSSQLDPALSHYLGWLPGFSASPTEYAGGTGLILAIFILTIMVVPLTTALLRESLRAIPREQVESGLALGATRWEVLRRVQIPFARRSIPSALLLGFGRAVGETVAVFMVIGNEVKLPTSLFSGSATMATLLVGQFDSAFEYPDLLHALVEVALLLLAISLVVNLLGLRYFGARTMSHLGVGP